MNSLCLAWFFSEKIILWNFIGTVFYFNQILLGAYFFLNQNLCTSKTTYFNKNLFVKKVFSRTELFGTRFDRNVFSNQFSMNHICSETDLVGNGFFRNIFFLKNILLKTHFNGKVICWKRS